MTKRKAKTVTVTTAELDEIAATDVTPTEKVRLGKAAVQPIGESVLYRMALRKAIDVAHEIVSEGEAAGKDRDLIGEELLRTVVGMVLHMGIRVGYVLHEQDMAKSSEPE